MGTAVIGGSDGSETLLTGGVPLDVLLDCEAQNEK